MNLRHLIYERELVRHTQLSPAEVSERMWLLTTDGKERIEEDPFHPAHGFKFQGSVTDTSFEFVRVRWWGGVEPLPRFTTYGRMEADGEQTRVTAVVRGNLWLFGFTMLIAVAFVVALLFFANNPGVDQMSLIYFGVLPPILFVGWFVDFWRDEKHIREGLDAVLQAD